MDPKHPKSRDEAEGGRHPLNLQQCADARRTPRSTGGSNGQAPIESACGGDHPLRISACRWRNSAVEFASIGEIM